MPEFNLTSLPQNGHLIAYAVTILLGLYLTRPGESPGRRWIRILISLVVVQLGLDALPYLATHRTGFADLDDTGNYLKGVPLFLTVAVLIAVVSGGWLTNIGASIFEFLLDSP